MARQRRFRAPFAMVGSWPWPWSAPRQFDFWRQAASPTEVRRGTRPGAGGVPQALRSGQQSCHHGGGFDTGESLVETEMPVRQPRVVDSQQVQECRVQIAQ